MPPTVFLVSGSTASDLRSRLDGVEAMYRRPATQLMHGGEHDG